tara:strand:- start:1813 stop:1989 length:177 start_codon:yes stop_codon:yes gene_type:complete
MAKVRDIPVKAQEAPETPDLTPEQAKAVLADNERLRGLLRAVAADLLALRDYIGKAVQ